MKLPEYNRLNSMVLQEWYQENQEMVGSTCCPFDHCGIGCRYQINRRFQDAAQSLKGPFRRHCLLVGQAAGMIRTHIIGAITNDPLFHWVQETKQERLVMGICATECDVPVPIPV